MDTCYTVNENGKIKCRCGGEFKKEAKRAHEKTENHQVYLRTDTGKIFKFYYNSRGQAVQRLNWKYDNHCCQEISIIK